MEIILLILSRYCVSLAEYVVCSRRFFVRFFFFFFFLLVPQVEMQGFPTGIVACLVNYQEPNSLANKWRGNFLGGAAGGPQ